MQTLYHRAYRRWRLWRRVDLFCALLWRRDGRGHRTGWRLAWEVAALFHTGKGVVDVSVDR